MGRTDRGRTAALASLVAAMFGFGVVPIFLRHFASHLDAWTVNGVRYSAGALFWLPFLLLLERAPTPGIGRGRVWRDALAPSAVNAVGQALFALGPYYVSASTLGFVIRLSFLFTIVFGFAFLPEERPLARRRLFWIGAIVSVAGVAAMFVDELRADSGGSWIGMTILVATGLAWGGYAVAVRRYMAAYTARESFSVISLYTSAALVALMLLFGDVTALASIGPGMWGLLMMSALVGIAFGHVLYYRGIHRLGPVVSSGIMLVTPLVTYSLAALLLDERLGSGELAGGLLVIAGGAALVVARGQVEETADDLP